MTPKRQSPLPRNIDGWRSWLKATWLWWRGRGGMVFIADTSSVVVFNADGSSFGGLPNLSRADEDLVEPSSPMGLAFLALTLSASPLVRETAWEAAMTLSPEDDAEHLRRQVKLM